MSLCSCLWCIIYVASLTFYADYLTTALCKANLQVFDNPMWDFLSIPILLRILLTQTTNRSLPKPLITLSCSGSVTVWHLAFVGSKLTTTQQLLTAFLISIMIFMFLAHFDRSTYWLTININTEYKIIFQILNLLLSTFMYLLIFYSSFEIIVVTPHVSKSKVTGTNDTNSILNNIA